jgi:hypothetical protein
MTFTKLISASYVGVPKKNDWRVLETFLWYPRWIRGESRWLEKAKIKQVYTNWDQYSSYGVEWKNAEFINDEPEQQTKRQGQ